MDPTALQVRVDDLAQQRAVGSPTTRTAEPPFPSFMQPEDEVFVGHEDVLARLSASLGWVTMATKGEADVVASIGAGAGAGAGDGDGGGRGGGDRNGGGRGGRGGGDGAGGRVAAAASGAAGGDTAVISQAISGLGGVGKSAIARQLCRRLRRGGLYRRGIFWLLGETTSALQKGYHDMASQLALQVDPATPHAARDAAFAWMRSCDGWLLVLDNVDEPEAVKAFMPPTDVRGDIVVTTRADVDRLRAAGVLRHRGDEPVVLECLDGTTSVRLLCALCDRGVESLSDDERRAAEQLCVEELGGLPLAIEQAGAFMRDHGMGFVAYLALYGSLWQPLFSVEARMSDADAAIVWQAWLRVRGVDDAAVLEALRSYGVRRLDDLASLGKSRSRFDRALSSLTPMQRDDVWDAVTGGDGVPVASDVTRRSVRTTWELSMRSLSVAHVEMVRLLCSFGADDMPLDAIVACVGALPASNELRRLVLGDGETVRSTAALVSACADVLRVLSASSLVKWNASSSLASMHRLLQAVVLEASPAVLRETVATACMEGLASGLAPLVSSVQSHGLACDAASSMRVWLSHGHAVIEKHWRSMRWSSGVQRPLALMIGLVDAVASGARVVMQLDRAQALYRCSLAMKRRLHGDDADHPDVAASLANLAEVLREQGELSESARLHRESLAMRRRLHGDDADHSEVVASPSNVRSVVEPGSHRLPRYAATTAREEQACRAVVDHQSHVHVFTAAVVEARKASLSAAMKAPAIRSDKIWTAVEGVLRSCEDFLQVIAALCERTTAHVLFVRSFRILFGSLVVEFVRLY
jgi:hypothetical protein